MVAVGAPRRPPLACRPSPPQGGRSDVAAAFANRAAEKCAIAETANLPPSGSQVGEMSGSTAGGGVVPRHMSD
ncbi:hypothetical protein CK216_07680 [Mesorhizobium sp. WSM3876]|nr:hypothetical protein CK216_07680 [Mesorhizobium sp. WSM3876]